MHTIPRWHTGEAGKFLWVSPAKTLAEHHWRYRKQIRTLSHGPMQTEYAILQEKKTQHKGARRE